MHLSERLKGLAEKTIEQTTEQWTPALKTSARYPGPMKLEVLKGCMVYAICYKQNSNKQVVAGVFRLMEYHVPFATFSWKTLPFLFYLIAYYTSWSNIDDSSGTNKRYVLNNNIS